MNPTLSFAERLPGVVRNELEQVLAAITQSWQVEHRYDGTHQLPIDVPATSTDFIGNAAAWSVPGPTLKTFQYVVEGGRMKVWLTIVGSSVTAGSVALRVLIPGGYRATRQIGAMAWHNDAGTIGQGLVLTVADSRFIEFYLENTATAWSASTGTTSVAIAGFEFPVTRA